MRFTTKAEYGIIALLYLAKSDDGAPCTARDIAGSEALSIEYVEKLLNRLKQCGLVTSQRGPGGGYCLAKPAGEITMRHLIEALDGYTFQTFCVDEVRENIVCNHLAKCGLGDIWHGLKSSIDTYLDSVTLEQLLHRSHVSDKAKAGLPL